MRYALAWVALFSLFASPLHAEQTGSTLERIQQSGTVRIGFRESEPPMSFVDEKEQPAGYSIDLCNRIVSAIKSRLGKPDLAVKYVPVTASNRFQAVASHEIDILCGATTKTLARSEVVDFSQLTFVTGASLLSLDAARIGGISDLQGKKVAVVEGTTTIENLKQALQEAVSDAQVVPVASAAEGLAALESGDVDAFSSDQVVLIGLVVSQESPEKFAIADELFSYEPFALALRRNDSEFRLLADRVLSQLYRSGQITPIYSKWFGRLSSEVPSLLEAMYILNSTPE
jgi:glutamate/aspartate transport system substrate-binding protein